jgi:hypothetical protein
MPVEGRDWKQHTTRHDTTRHDYSCLFYSPYFRLNHPSNKAEKGRAMTQAVSRRPPTAKARFRSRFSPCGIRGGQSGTGTVFPPEYFGFPQSVSFHRCSITRKNGEKLIIFITGLHNKPQGCGASVASAAGPLKKVENAHKLSVLWG